MVGGLRNMAVLVVPLLKNLFSNRTRFCDCHWYILTQTDMALYRVIQEESAILWEMIVCVIVSKKFHINMCPIFDGYVDMTV
jgi:hypothetical protein